SSDVMAAVLRADPDWKALPAGTPAPIVRLLKRCLEKDRKRRLPSIGVARLEIDDALAASEPESAPALATPVPVGTLANQPVIVRHSRLSWVLAGVVLVLALAVGVLWTGRSPVLETWS